MAQPKGGLSAFGVAVGSDLTQRRPFRSATESNLRVGQPRALGSVIRVVGAQALTKPIVASSLLFVGSPSASRASSQAGSRTASRPSSGRPHAATDHAPRAGFCSSNNGMPREIVGTRQVDVLSSLVNRMRNCSEQCLGEQPERSASRDDFVSSVCAKLTTEISAQGYGSSVSTNGTCKSSSNSAASDSATPSCQHSVRWQIEVQACEDTEKPRSRRASKLRPVGDDSASGCSESANRCADVKQGEVAPCAKRPAWLLPSANASMPLDASVASSSNISDTLQRPLSGSSATSLQRSSSGSTTLSMSANLKAGETVGQGSFGRVFTAQHQESGRIIAVKEILLKPDDNTAERVAVSKEIHMFEKLDHPNIVQYLGCEFTPCEARAERLYIFLEYCGGGSVAQQLQTYGCIDGDLAKRHTSQLLSGVGYLHSQEPAIVHRDLKCANILATQDGTLKIADFGCSKQLSLTASAQSITTGKLSQQSIAGSVFWMAPEALSGSHLTTASDVWSIGCCVLEMVTARQPWHGQSFDNIFAAYRAIVESEDVPSVPETASPHLASFITECIQRDFKKRPRVHQLQEHMFVRDHAAVLG